MSTRTARLVTPGVVGALLLLLCATEAWQIARLHSEQHALEQDTRGMRGSAVAGRAFEGGSPEQQRAEVSQEIEREVARLAAANAEMKSIEAAVPGLATEELRSVGQIEGFGIEAAEFIETLVRTEAMKGAKKTPDEEKAMEDQLMAQLTWMQKLSIVSEMEDSPAEIARLHSATIAKRLNLDGTITTAVRTQIEKEFTDLAAAGMTHSHCPKEDPKPWRKRRGEAVAQAILRVEALIPPARRAPHVVGQSLGLGDALISEVKVDADGHGSMGFGIRLQGVGGGK